jgi:hypothetical protein
LELLGCAAGQESVARFVKTLKEIDGVTRVGVQYSELPSGGGGSGDGGEGGSVSASGDCQSRNFIAQFSLVVAFDAAPIPPAGSAVGVEVTAAPEPAPAEGEAGTEGEGE